MIPRDDAIVLRRIRYANTSLVVSYHTRRHGYVSVLAKGARRPRRKGVYDRAPDLFCVGELVWYPRRGSELGIQAEWSESDDHPHLVQSLPAVRAANRIVDVLAAFSRDAEPSSALFDQARISLAALNAGAGLIAETGATSDLIDRLGMLLLHFDLRAMEIAGYGPNMARCISCDREPNEARLRFSPTLGGILCGPCSRSSQAAGSIPLPAVAADAARRLAESKIDGVMDVPLNRSAQRALRRAMDAALTYNLERNMRSFRAPRRRAQPRATSA